MNKSPRRRTLGLTNKNEELTVIPFDTKNAKRLLETIREKLHIRRKVKFANWERQFASLRSKYGAKLVEEVLEWFVENCHRRKTPKCTTASAFASQFERILKLAKKPKRSPRFSDTVENLAIRIRESVAFSMDDHELKHAIEQSLVNCAKIRETIVRYGEISPGSRGISRFLIEQLAPCNQFVYRWFVDLLTWAREHQADIRSFDFLVVKPDHWKTRAIINGLIADYTKRNVTWESIVREVSE